MKKWFCDNDKKFMKKNYESILQVPKLIGEENLFISKVENVWLNFSYFIHIVYDKFNNNNNNNSI